MVAETGPGVAGRRSRAQRWGWVWITLTAALLAAGCASDDGGGTDTATAETTEVGGEAAGGEAAGAFPVEIPHEFGSTVIESAPERVAVVGLTEQDALLALGVVPVATTEWFGDHPGSIHPWAQDELEALGGEVPTSLGSSAEINFEGVAAARPDLIVATYAALDETQYETLSAIAPTIAQPGDVSDYGIGWDEQLLTVGRALGKADEAEALVAEVEGLFEQARADHPEFEGATAVVATPDEGIWVYGPEDARGRLLTALGFELPDDLAEVTGNDFGGNVSVENSEYLDIDLVVWLDYSAVAGTSQASVYESLPVHTDGREVHLDSFDDPLGAAMSFVTVLSIPFLLDGIVPMMATAIDGDPATVVEHP